MGRRARDGGCSGAADPRSGALTRLDQPCRAGSRRSDALPGWEDQFRRACEGFERNGFFVLIGVRQAASLDETFEVKADTEVSFVS